MAHANARLTEFGRLLLVQRITELGWPPAQAAESLGVSRATAYKWLGRYHAEGAAGLADRSSRPRRCPHALTASQVRRVLAARRRRRQGPHRLAWQLGMARSTVSGVLRRHGMSRLAHLDRPSGAVVRYQREHPGELVHLDVKKLGRIPDGGGWRALGRAARETTRNRTSKLGYDYVHSLVDDHSRLAYSEILPDEKGTTCAAFLDRAAAYFAAHGITRIERVMTDNAWAYRWSLREVITALGARQTFIKPHCPWQNGKVERLNRTLATEWAYRQVFACNAERAAALAPWIEHYNTRRRHSALGGLPPISRVEPT
jgi:transposase InsO family protein